MLKIVPGATHLFEEPGTLEQAAKWFVAHVRPARTLLPITASALGDNTLGAEHAEIMRQLPHMHCIDALCRDGFNDFETGGTVELAKDGRAVADYPITPFLIDGQRVAQEKLMEIQFAAGALEVRPWHIDMPRLTSLATAKQWLASADLGSMKLSRGSAHVMGGCSMSATLG